MNRFIFFLICILLSPSLFAQRLVVIGVDGLSPIGIENAHTPRIDELVKQGSYSFTARSVMPTSSSPNWMSMISGAGPEQHGVLSNKWKPGKYDIEPTCVDKSGRFPSIFTWLHEKRPELHTACFHDWAGFARLFDTQAANTVEHTQNEIRTTEEAIAYFQAEQPDFLFIHLDHVDHALHMRGFASKPYFKAVEEADQLIGQIVDSIQAAGQWKETTLIITADHGGKGRKHGGSSMQEIQIPWIICGQEIRANHRIEQPINIYDTAVTIAWWFGLEPHPCWIGKAIQEVKK